MLLYFALYTEVNKCVINPPNAFIAYVKSFRKVKCKLQKIVPFIHVISLIQTVEYIIRDYYTFLNIK